MTGLVIRINLIGDIRAHAGKRRHEGHGQSRTAATSESQIQCGQHRQNHGDNGHIVGGFVVLSEEQDEARQNEAQHQNEQPDHHAGLHLV